MENLFMSDGKRNTYKCLKVTFTANEIEDLFITGFAMVYADLKEIGLWQKFQEIQKVVKESVDEVVDVFEGDDTIKFEIQMLSGRQEKWLSFHLKIADNPSFVPVLLNSDRATQIRCRSIAEYIKEHGHPELISLMEAGLKT